MNYEIEYTIVCLIALNKIICKLKKLKHNTQGGGVDTEGKGIKQEELSPGTRPQLEPDGRPELVEAKYR